MNDPFLMRVLHGLADGDEELQTLPRRQVLLVAVAGDRHPLDQLHHEVGSARTAARDVAPGRTGVEHLGDIGVIHQGQRLPLGLEAGQHLATVHARLHQLERDFALHRLRLLGHVDRAHAPFADLLQQLVRPNHRAGGFRRNCQVDGGGKAGGRGFQKAAGTKVILDQLLHAGSKGLVIAATVLDEPLPLFDLRDFDGGGQNTLDIGHFCLDGRSSPESVPNQCVNRDRAGSQILCRPLHLFSHLPKQPGTGVNPMPLGGRRAKFPARRPHRGSITRRNTAV